MNPLIDPQELVSRSNEDETVWREYESLRRLHHCVRLGMTILNSLLDRIHWLTVERKHRVVRCIGKALL
jgi:hypothetical protein